MRTRSGGEINIFKFKILNSKLKTAILVVTAVLLLPAIITQAAARFSFTTSDSDSEDTVKFEIQIDDNDDFSSPIIDYVSNMGNPGDGYFEVGQSETGGSYGTGSPSTSLPEGKYYYRVKAIDIHEAESDWTSTTKDTDTTPPSCATNFSITTGDKLAKLNWTNPTDSDFAEVIVHRQVGSGKVVDEGTGSSTATGAQIAGLTNNLGYKFWLTCKDNSGNESDKTDSLTVYPGAVRTIVADELIGPSLNPVSGETIAPKNLQVFGSVVGMQANPVNLAPILTIDGNKLQFATVTGSAILSKPVDVATLSTPPSTSQIATWAKKTLIENTEDGRYEVIWSDNGNLMFSKATEVTNTEFSTPYKIASGLTPNWHIKLLKDQGSSMVVGLTGSNTIATWKQSGSNSWTEQTVVSSKNKIVGFDAEVTKSGVAIAYQTVNSSRINLGDNQQVLFKAGDSNYPVKIYGGNLTGVPQLSIDKAGTLHMVVWQGSDNTAILGLPISRVSSVDFSHDVGLTEWVYNKGIWRAAIPLIKDKSTQSYKGSAPYDAFWDGSRGLVTIWNSTFAPSTYFGFHPLSGAVNIKRGRSVSDPALTPKVVPFGTDRYIYIVGNKGFIYKLK